MINVASAALSWPNWAKWSLPIMGGGGRECATMYQNRCVSYHKTSITTLLGQSNQTNYLLLREPDLHIFSHLIIACFFRFWNPPSLQTGLSWSNNAIWVLFLHLELWTATPRHWELLATLSVLTFCYMILS